MDEGMPRIYVCVSGIATKSTAKCDYGYYPGDLDAIQIHIVIVSLLVTSQRNSGWVYHVTGACLFRRLEESIFPFH